MVRLVAEIMIEHRRTTRLLEALHHEVEALERAAPVDHFLVRDLIDYFTGFPERVHHRKEDAVYRLLQVKRPVETAAIFDLAAAHAGLKVQTGALAETFARIDREIEFPRVQSAITARAFIDGLSAHMREEEAGFLPLAAASLEPADERRIKDMIASTPELRIDAEEERRFKRLYRSLVVIA